MSGNDACSPIQDLNLSRSYGTFLRMAFLGQNWPPQAGSWQTQGYLNPWNFPQLAPQNARWATNQQLNRPKSCSVKTRRGYRNRKYNKVADNMNLIVVGTNANGLSTKKKVCFV